MRRHLLELGKVLAFAVLHDDEVNLVANANALHQGRVPNPEFHYHRRHQILNLSVFNFNPTLFPVEELNHASARIRLAEHRRREAWRTY